MSTCAVGRLSGSLIEKMVTPISLQKIKKSKEKQMRERRYNKIVLSVAGLLTVIIIFSTIISSLGTGGKVIRIAGKDFTEQHILVNMFADLIEEKTDLNVERKVNLGGTQVCFSALKSGDIDLYFDYSGTAYGDTLNYPPISDMNKVYNTVKKDFKEKFNISVLKQMGFNNTYVLAVTKETAQKYNLKSISDMAKVALI